MDRGCIVNRVVRIGLGDRTSSELSLKEVKWEAMWIYEHELLQTQGAITAKTVRQDMPSMLGTGKIPQVGRARELESLDLKSLQEFWLSI